MLLGQAGCRGRAVHCLPLCRIASICLPLYQHHICCRHLATVRPLAVIPGMNHAQFSNGAQLYRCSLRLRKPADSMPILRFMLRTCCARMTYYLRFGTAA